MLKKLILGVLGIMVSHFAYPGTMGPACIPENLSLGCGGYWDFNVQALYLRPAFGAGERYQPSLESGLYKAVNHAWDWGTRLEASYYYGCNTDISLNWIHFKGRARLYDLLTILPTADLDPPLDFSTNQSTFNLSSHNQFDEINLVFGQTVDFASSTSMRLYAGLQYANIQADNTYYFNLRPEPPYTALSQFDNSHFKGLGPSSGMDIYYHLSSQFSLRGTGAVSVLVGKSRFSKGFVAAPIGWILLPITGHKIEIVPSLEAKLGINYACDNSWGRWNIELGYESLNYFNALQNQGFAGNGSSSITNADFGLYGPYISLQYTAMV